MIKINMSKIKTEKWNGKFKYSMFKQRDVNGFLVSSSQNHDKKIRRVCMYIQTQRAIQDNVS